MGKNKRPAGPAQIPLFYAKKRKLNEATQLTALVALHKYCAKFKLGAPGFRPLTTAPHHEVCVVMDGAELGAVHDDADLVVRRRCQRPEAGRAELELGAVLVQRDERRELRRLVQLALLGVEERDLGRARGALVLAHPGAASARCGRRKQRVNYHLLRRALPSTAF